MKIIPLVTAGLLVTALACTDSTAPTTPAPGPSAAATAATSLVFWQMSVADGNLACGVTTDFVPYCWGINNADIGVPGLGTGSATGPDTCTGAAGPFDCATKPALVAGNHRFTRISAGGTHSCGVTADFHAWCWGANAVGDLGTGGTQPALAPVAVSGGLRFRQVEVASDHSCGVTYPDNRLYCWGDNSEGQLGDGSLSRRLSPVRVLLDQKVSQVATGRLHTCAVTPMGKAFCWGTNREGELGDSTNATRRTRPSAVVGKHVFRQIDAGFDHTCAVTTDDRAFCWGNGRLGALGNGKTYLSYWPRAVSGGLHIRRVSTGFWFTCAETTNGKGWCWGDNHDGQLGNGDAAVRTSLKPVAVAGGLTFGQLSAGNENACGKTTAGTGYCWGEGLFGTLGNGTSGMGSKSFSPVAVVARD